MKKICAAILALTMACTVMASCGNKTNDSSTAATTSSTEDSTEASAAESTAEESTATESTAESSADKKDESLPPPKDISEMPGELKNQETASFKFSKDMNIDDFVSSMSANDFTDDESHVKMSIVELEGVPMLKVETLDKDRRGENYKVPKIHFDISKLFKGKEDQLPKIFEIKMDIVTKAEGTIKNDEGEDCKVPAFVGGKFVTQPYMKNDDGTDNNGWQELEEFGWSEWSSEWAAYELDIKPGIKEDAKFVNTTKPQYLALMKWSIPNKQDLYIANITFIDENGEVISCDYK